jgi:glycosyltransferase involved in cell wall biosynthesis
VNGFLFDPGNAGDLTNKLELLLDLPDTKIRGMGRAAREKIEKEYSAGLHYERLMAVYRRAIRNN